MQVDPSRSRPAALGGNGRVRFQKLHFRCADEEAIIRGFDLLELRRDDLKRLRRQQLTGQRWSVMSEASAG